jgi:pimeloyl-ACP methyl ester carboxylesterase/DNA-binding CsgD family transcriptional regulator
MDSGAGIKRSDQATLFEAMLRDPGAPRWRDTAARLLPRPVLDADALALAVLDGDARVLWSDERFEHWLGAAPIERDKRSSVVRSENGPPVLLVQTPAANVQNWPLPDEAHAALTHRNARTLAMAVSTARAQRPLMAAARAYGLTQSEARLAEALLATANLRRAAELAGLSYESARQALKAALRKTGAARQPALIALLSQKAASFRLDRDQAQAVLMDALGLRARDARLALLVSDGLTRGEAAKTAHISESVAKDAFERIFTQLGVSSAAELSRVVLEALAGSLVAEASGGELLLCAADHDPLRFIARPVNAGFIAISDFGPTSAAPLIILHSSSTTRHPSRKLVRALQADGWRPIAIDRPGFGLSDPAPTTDACPFEDAARDMDHVCAALGFASVALIARGGAHAALAFARLYPERAREPIVLLNPDPTIDDRAKRVGILGAVKDAFFGHPQRLSYLARIVGAQATPERVRQLIRATLGTSQPDMLAFEDPEAVADYQRAVMMFATGRVEGFIREQRAYVCGINDPPLTDASNWTVLLGAHDPLHHAPDMANYWAQRLPKARFDTIADAGRFLHLTHTTRVVAALRG